MPNKHELAQALCKSIIACEMIPAADLALSVLHSPVAALAQLLKAQPRHLATSLDRFIAYIRVFGFIQTFIRACHRKAMC